MDKIIYLFIIIVQLILVSIIFEKLDYKYNIRIKYFSFVAKKRTIFYIFLIIWIIIFVLILTNCNNYYIFLILILYFDLFMILYHRIRSWKFAYNVYIKNIDLLLKAKERDKRKRKKEKCKNDNKAIRKSNRKI